MKRAVMRSHAGERKGKDLTKRAHKPEEQTYAGEQKRSADTRAPQGSDPAGGREGRTGEKVEVPTGRPHTTARECEEGRGKRKTRPELKLPAREENNSFFSFNKFK